MLHFILHVTRYLNQLNTTLRGRGNIVFSLFKQVVSFEKIMVLFAYKIERKTLLHFLNLSQYQNETNVGNDEEYLNTVILKKNESFIKRFQDF